MKKQLTLKVCTGVLFLIALFDMLRGYMHTFDVRYAAENLAGIGSNPDGLFLLGAFGISNFLTTFIYFLVIWKARDLVPYILLLIPMSYFLGGAGINYSGVEPEAPFVGQHVMKVYLLVCLLTSMLFFIFLQFNRTKNNKMADAALEREG